MATEHKRSLVTYGKRHRRPAPAEEAVVSPARPTQTTPSGLLPLSAVSPALKRIWQQRQGTHASNSTKTIASPFARVKADTQPRTPLSDHTNAPLRATSSKLTTGKSKKTSPKLSPYARKPVVRTYRSKAAAQKLVLDDSSSSSDYEPTPRPRKGKAKATLVADSDSDGPAPRPALRSNRTKAAVVVSDNGSDGASAEVVQRSSSRLQNHAPSLISQSKSGPLASSSNQPVRSHKVSPVTAIVISDDEGGEDNSYNSAPQMSMRVGTCQTSLKNVPQPRSDVVLKPTLKSPATEMSRSDLDKLTTTPPRHSVPARRLVPYVILTPLQRAPKNSQISVASPSKRAFVARVATPIRAVFPPRRRAPSTVASTTSSLPSEESLCLEVPSTPAISHVDDVPRHLKSLLHECGQDAPYKFTSFLETLPLDETLLGRIPKTQRVLRKLGEASFSEVFAIGDVVLKVVPLRNEELFDEEDEEWTLPDVSDASDVLREVVMTREIGAQCSGFTKLITTYVVCGAYPKLLLDLWDVYKQSRGSESIRPDGFPSSQAYSILVLPNLGTDLETFVFKPTSGWAQACAIFWQVAQSLADAEERASFEHRDLHWGQILVQRVQVGDSDRLDSESHGVRATIIDLGLSRMQLGADDEPRWTPFADEIFDGIGDYQFDIYRLMRTHNRGNWAAYNPITNVMWLHYLAVQLTQHKRLRTPRTANERVVSKYLLETVDMLASSVSLSNTKRKPRKGSDQLQPKSASDVVRWATKRGWLP